jgi:hypothetical protein
LERPMQYNHLLQMVMEQSRVDREPIFSQMT